MILSWLSIVASVYRAGLDSFSQGGVELTRVRGGGNNALFRVSADGENFAVKLCVQDARHRAEREYGALALFARLGFNLAPKPVLIDTNCALLPHPIVIYHWLDGEPLFGSVNEAQLTALLALVRQTHSIHQADIPEIYFRDAEYHHFDFAWYLDELQGLFSKYGEWLAERPEDAESYDRIRRLTKRCIQYVSNVNVNPERPKITLCFCHVDSNLANFIWNERGELHWIDWEYSGWGDPALELAEFESHLGADALTPTQRGWLRQKYCLPEGDHSFDERITVWDHILFTRWALLVARALWSAYHGSDRVRLTTSNDGPDIIRERLVKTIERAEKFLDG